MSDLTLHELADRQAIAETIIGYGAAIDGDSAVTVANLHATQVLKSVPNASITVGRYHNRLVRTSEGWKIAEHVLEVGWRGTAQPR
jgi:SnoaL-like domain